MKLRPKVEIEMARRSGHILKVILKFLQSQLCSLEGLDYYQA